MSYNNIKDLLNYNKSKNISKDHGILTIFSKKYKYGIENKELFLKEIKNINFTNKFELLNNIGIRVSY